MRKDVGEYTEDAWNVLDGLGLLVSLSGLCVRFFVKTSPWGRSLYALSAPLLFSRILFFAQVLPFQGPMVQASLYDMQPAPLIGNCSSAFVSYFCARCSTWSPHD